MAIVEEIKEQNEPKVKQLRLSIEGGSGFKTVVLAKPSTKVYKLLDAFCVNHKLDIKEHRLIYNDRVLRLEDRLETYEIAGDATINVVASQTGGNWEVKGI